MRSPGKLLQFTKSDEGGGLAENVLIFPLLALVLTAIVELGFILRDWITVNNVVHAATLFVTAHANNNPEGTSLNLYNLNPFSSASIVSATSKTNSGLSSGNVNLVVTTACRCPTATGITCPAPPNSGEFASTAPKCPTADACADTVATNVSLRVSAYICISGSLTHSSWFGRLGWAPTLTARSVINIH